MGFKSTIVSEHYAGNLPSWFKEKYKDKLTFPDGLLVASRTEAAFYSNDIFNDYQKALIEIDFFDDDFTVGFVVISEDQTISKVLVGRDEVKFLAMEDGYVMSSVRGQ